MSKNLKIIKYFKIKGMTCRNCEKKLEKTLEKLPAILSSKAEYVNGIITITLTEDQPDETIISLINEAGYTGKKINRIGKLYYSLYPFLLGIIIVSVFYYAEGKTQFLSRIPEIHEGISYPLLFTVGILTSIHCIGMCGGINISQTCISAVESSRLPTIKRSFQYNSGRIISYTVLGGIIGGIGSVLSISSVIQGLIIITAGIIMIIMGFNMIGLFSILKKLVPVIPDSISKRIQNLPVKRHPFITGLLNGFMPCGPLQSMQLYALSTGSFFKGALSMFLFSAGTVPLMFLFGIFSILFTKRFQKNMIRISALLILVLGWSMISRGLSLNGIDIDSMDTEEVAVHAAIAKLEGEIQIVESDVSPGGYEPIIVQAGIPVQWIMVAGPGDITGCNNAIVSKSFGIKQSLREGRTLVEFTPEQSGNFSFTCWMGMIDSNILVVDDLSSFDPDLLNTAVEAGPERVEIQIPEFNTDDIQMAILINNKQTYQTTVDENGFTPSISVMQVNVDTEWSFISTTDTDKTQSLVFPTFNAQLDLKDKGRKTVEIVPAEDFYFYSWKGDYLGFVIVVDDLGNVDKDEILNKVRSYINN